MIEDTRHFTKSVQDQLGPQVFSGPQTLMAELCRVSGSLAGGILVTEGKRPARSGTTVRLAHDISDVLYILISISDYYHIDLERAWNDLIQEGWGNLAKLQDMENETGEMPERGTP
ncbi:hypothetical protein KSF_078600 [Reticulibacter mediterranei]|uniref:Uncharacterized protein n=2 Tax=Reticulibacter mediterranei TaxID=2778369 RepID=A0A8J3IVZ3_9CHLR|nr:hypothetical protein KSF_078600 [Reticulibacter mediterranei]